MRYPIAVLLFILTCAAQAADLEAGKAAYMPCTACHGANGEGNLAMNSPVLAGLDAAYLERQLRHFKARIRGAADGDMLGMQMRGMSATLADDAAITNVSAYIASLPYIPVTGDPGDADLRNGENLYIASCGACHGGKAQGNVALNAPRLAGQHRSYVERQYKNFAAGLRGNHPQDRLGRQMRLMSNMLATDKDISDVMAWIESQGINP